MKRRRGTMLIELVVAMVVGSVVLGVTVAVLYLLMQTQGIARYHLHQSTGLSRLAEQFRRDVHAASVVLPQGGTGSWKFELGRGHAVTYRAQSSGLLRVENGPQATPRREEFALPPGTDVSIQFDQEASATVVSMSLAPAADAVKPVERRVARFDAVLAADHRFGKPLESDASQKSGR